MPETKPGAVRSAPPRGEVVVVGAATREALLRRAQEILAFLGAAGAVSLKDLAFTLNTESAGQARRLGIVAASAADLSQKLQHAARALSDPLCRRIKDKSGIYYFEEPLGAQGRLAFLFPGEGSQYPHMLSDLCVAFPEARACFDRVDRAFADHERGYLPSDFIFPKRPQDAERMWQMDGAVEAVFTANAALHSVLARLAIRPDVMVGHSTGDYSALVASGCIGAADEETFIRFMLDLNVLYRRLEQEGAVPKAALVAVGSPEPGAARRFAQGDETISVAMDNCPHQFVLAGTEEGLRPVVEDLRRGGAVCDPLPFARAYHTPQFRPVCALLADFYRRLPMAPPRVEVYSCASVAPLPRDLEAIRAISVEQWALPVRFRETIEALYASGVRLFVEVGPRGNLTNFVDDILRGRPHAAIPADVRHRRSLEQLHHLLALLAAHGAGMDLRPLYDGRAPRPLPLDRPDEVRSAGRRGARMSLLTGCPPMKLSDETAAHIRAYLHPQAPATPPAAGPADQVNGPAPVQAPASASAPGPGAPGPVAPGSDARTPQGQPGFAERILSAHLKTMEQFLSVQEQVMRAFLTGLPTAAHDRPQPALPVAAADPAALAAEARAVPAAAPAVETPVAAPPQAAPLAAAGATARLDRAAIADTLLRLVSDRTGYPRDMLDPKLNLEADLGIDSIKRVEIFGTFQQQTNLLGPGDMEAVGTRKTLEDVIDFVASRQEGALAPQHMPAAPAAAVPAGATSSAPGVTAGAAAHVGAAPAGLPRMPFIGTVLSHRPGEEFQAVRTLTLDEDLFLRDHTLGRNVSAADPGLTGLPVVPLTMSMEMLAEAGAALAPGMVLAGMRDVRAHRWIVLEDNSTTLRLAARRIADGDGRQIRVQIFEEGAAAPDAVAGRPVVEGTMVFAAAYPEPPPAAPLPLKGERRSRWSAERLYKEGMFHGPAFRGVASMDLWGEDGAVATLVALNPDGLFREHSGRSLVTDPVLLDQPGQVVGFWTAEHLEHGFVVFPFHLEALHLYGPRPQDGASLRCLARIALVADRQVRSDFDVVAPDGRLWARFIAWEDRRFEVPAPLFRAIMSPGEAHLCAPLPVSQFSSVPDDERVCCRLDLSALPRELFEGHGGLWRRVLAQVVLSRRERAAAAAIEAPRRLDWLLSRVVAKDTVRRFLLERYGLRVPPADVEIVETDGDRLRAEGDWAHSIGVAPAVSVGAYGGSLFAAVGEARAAQAPARASAPAEAESPVAMLSRPGSEG